MDIALTNREAEIMQVLWEHGPSIVGEVQERLPDELAYTTVLTMLRTLESKGYVGHEEQGRSHRYFARVKQQAARKNAVRHLTKKLFKGSSELLLTHLVADSKLSEQEVSRIRMLLEKRAAKED